MRQVGLALAVAVLAGAAAADEAADRIVAAFLETDAYFYPDTPRASVRLDGCQLQIEKTEDRQVFGVRDFAWLADLDLSAPRYVLDRKDGFVKADIVISEAAERGLAPAFWRLIGGADADRPSDEAVVARMRGWDPLAMGEWADPSMMTRFQQVVHDRAWSLAENGAGGARLARTHWEWLGPARDDWRPVFRWPGGTLTVVRPEGDIAPFMALMRDYVARTCP